MLAYFHLYDFGNLASTVRLSKLYPQAQFKVTEYLQEAVIKKKYGGVLPKKSPLISKVSRLLLHYLLDIYTIYIIYIKQSGKLI